MSLFLGCVAIAIGLVIAGNDIGVGIHNGLIAIANELRAKAR